MIKLIIIISISIYLELNFRGPFTTKKLDLINYSLKTNL